MELALVAATLRRGRCGVAVCRFGLQQHKLPCTARRWPGACPWWPAPGGAECGGAGKSRCHPAHEPAGAVRTPNCWPPSNEPERQSILSWSGSGRCCRGGASANRRARCRQISPLTNTNLIPPLPTPQSPVNYFRQLLQMSPAERNRLAREPHARGPRAHSGQSARVSGACLPMSANCGCGRPSCAGIWCRCCARRRRSATRNWPACQPELHDLVQGDGWSNGMCCRRHCNRSF